jgi:hypothetical protein
MAIDLTGIKATIDDGIQANATPTPGTTEGLEMQTVLKTTWEQLDDQLALVFYNKTQINDFLAGKASSEHNHDSDYYLKSEVYTKLEVDLEIAENGGKPTVWQSVADESAMLALNAYKGDIAIRADVNQTFILANEPATLLANWVQIEVTTSEDLTKQSISEKNQPNGYAGLDVQSKLALSQIPPKVLQRQGAWNATANTPTLADGTGNEGDFYNVATAGTQNLGSGNISYSIGDWAWYNGSVWLKAATSGSVSLPDVVEFKQASETLQQYTIANGTVVNIDFSLGTYVEINITSTVGINLTFSGTTGKYGFAVLKITGNAQNINLPAGTTQPDADGYATANLVVPRTKTGAQRLTVDYANDTYYVSPSSTI